MPRTCSVCGHDDRPAIEQALVNQKPYRHIAAQFRVSTGALQRHRAEHMPPALAEAKADARRAEAVDLWAQLEVVSRTGRLVLAEAAQAKDYALMLKAAALLDRQTPLLAKLYDELDERPQVVLQATPEWQAVQRAIIEALRPYPEARTAVAGALAALERNRG